VGKGMVERALKARRHRPMFMVDLAVPRDIEAEVGELDDVFLYSLDSLGKIIEQNAEKRAAAVAEATVIIDRHTRDFSQWLESRSATPFIQSLRSRADQYRRIELEKAARRLAKGEDPAAVMEALANGISGKFLHHPLSALQRAQGEERSQLVAALEKIYPDQEEP
ncbi:MAG TPA: glutamyl-tRNA reductase, partial [Usitatibacteraceae bacterium]|nr:glutamyl-tRNA reductase [Usitatibacteraceae bacterium]